MWHRPAPATGVARSTAFLAALLLTGCAAGSQSAPDPLSPTTTPEVTPTSAATPLTDGSAQLAAGAPMAPGSCPDAATLTLKQQLRQTIMVWSDPSTGPVPAAYRDLGGIFITGSAPITGGYLDLAQSPIPPLVAVDEEGGRVQRIDGEFGSLPSARQQARLGPEEVERLAYQRGVDLRSIGVTMDLAPVVDLDDGPAGAVIGDRSYGARPNRVIALAGAFARGLQRAGILPTLKHFPGHGRADGDSHATLPTTPAIDELRSRDLRPYRRLLGSAANPTAGPWAVMVGHLLVPGLTRGRTAASLDPNVYRYLRETIGFTGLAVTDELTGMAAVSDSHDATGAAVAALAAGADLLLLSQPGDIDTLVSAMSRRVQSGKLPAARVQEAAAHVLAVKICPAG